MSITIKIRWSPLYPETRMTMPNQTNPSLRLRSRAFPTATVLPIAAILSVVTACGGGDAPAPDAASDLPEAPERSIDPRDDWWANLSAPCGSAFPGRLALAPPGDDMLRGDELLVVYFDVCGDDEIRLPFHIEKEEGEWDRSRTWIFRRMDDGRIELRHDHRQPDGTEDRVTWYGAWTIEEGSSNEQRFVIRDREYEDGSERGWRVIIEPGTRYVYGTTRNGEWRWRVEFDLSEAMPEPPPPAWGYEGGGGPLR